MSSRNLLEMMPRRLIWKKGSISRLRLCRRRSVHWRRKNAGSELGERNNITPGVSFLWLCGGGGRAQHGACSGGLESDFAVFLVGSIVTSNAEVRMILLYHHVAPPELVP